MKKIFITLLAAALSLTMCVSTNASAYTFTNNDQLVNYKEKVPMQVQPLDDSVKDEIVQKLLQSDFNGSNADDIVVTYYGSLDGGKMLINSYDKTREYTTDEEADIINVAKYHNINFMYSVSSEKDVIKLYINGEFYSFKDAFDAGLINYLDLWQLVSCVDDFYFTYSYFENNSRPLGDVNNDGVLNVQDVTLMQKIVANVEPVTDEYIEYGDIDDSKTIDITDVTAAQKIINEIK